MNVLNFHLTFFTVFFDTGKTQQQPSTSNVPSSCLPIMPKKTHLPSEEIIKSELVDPNIIISKYPQYRKKGRIRTLARKLAEKSYFGEHVQKQCTVSGQRNEPALPLKELNDLKSKIFSLLLKDWGNPLEFEDTWSDCTISIGEACKNSRTKDKKK